MDAIIESLKLNNSYDNLNLKQIKNILNHLKQTDIKYQSISVIGNKDTLKNRLQMALSDVNSDSSNANNINNTHKVNYARIIYDLIEAGFENKDIELAIRTLSNDKQIVDFDTVMVFIISKHEVIHF